MNKMYFKSEKKVKYLGVTMINMKRSYFKIIMLIHRIKLREREYTTSIAR